MGIVFDIIIVLLIVLSTYLAYRKGLVALAIKLCATIIAVLITLVLYKPISNFIINTTSIDETIQNAIFEKAFNEVKNDEETGLTISVVEQTKANALAQTSREIAIKTINIGVIIILYFGLKFVLKFVTILANKIASLPIINKFNKAGGILYGIIRGLVVVYICLLLIGFVGKVNSKNYLYQTMNSSNLGKIMSENNVFNVLL